MIITWVGLHHGLRQVGDQTHVLLLSSLLLYLLSLFLLLSLSLLSLSFMMYNNYMGLSPSWSDPIRRPNSCAYVVFLVVVFVVFVFVVIVLYDNDNYAALSPS